MKTIKLKHLIKNIDAGDYLENFLISAVASMLIIRTFLTLTNYPQIGGGTFHISHILWGGLLMMISIIVLLTFLNRELRGFAAILGGMGFGVFIDELGKFITNDNNYFFQPTIAFIYVIFILVYLLYKFLDKPKQITEKEYAVNALEMIKEAVLHDFDPEEKRRAVEFLEKSDPQDPIIKMLSTTVAQIDALPLKKMGFISKFRNKIRHYYIKLIKLRLFSSLIIAFFAIASILNIIIVANNITSNQSFTHLGILFSSSVSGLFVILGIYFITIRRRLAAYEMFNTAILISIFLTQFFLFFEEKLSAITRFLISIVIWSVLQNLIHQEKLIKNNSETVPGQ